MILLSILFITFPDSLTIQAKEKMRVKRDLRKANKKSSSLSHQFPINSGITSIATNSKEFIHPKRTLSIIDESMELANEEIEKNVNYSVDTLAENSIQKQKTKRLKQQPSFSFDSISTISTTVSNYTSQSDDSAKTNNTTRTLVTADSIKNDETKSKTEQTKSSCFKSFLVHRFGSILKSILKLFLNFRYVLLIFIMSIEVIIISIFSHYMTLYTQNIYKIPNSKVSIMVGGILVPAAIAGA